MLDKLTKIGTYVPHIYFSVVGIFLGFSSNIYTLVTLAIIVTLVFVRHKVLNFVFSAFAMFYSFWTLLTFISELGTVQYFDSIAVSYLVLGSLFIITNFFMSTLLAVPFFKSQMDLDESSLYVSFAEKTQLKTPRASRA